jgi:hypothetical protein
VTVQFVVRCFIGAAFMLSAQFANAQLAGQGATLPASEISAFQANPGQLLTQFRDGGPEMVKQIRSLVGSDKATLATIIALAKTANEDQRKAIGEGLAQIAKAYATNDPAFANQIQQSVASSGIPELAKAYAQAAGDTATASTGGGGGAGGGGGPSGAGAPGGGANPGSFSSTSNFAANGSSNLLTGGNSGGGGFSQISPF